MKTIQLGKTDLEIAPIIFGGNVFGWTLDQKQSHAILDAFSNGGFNAIDTADVYSRWAQGNQGGESETLIGNWLKQNGKRNQVVLMTKVGSDMGNGKKGLKKEYIIRAAEDSLRRLQTDHIDLYQTHFDEESTPVEETLSAYESLVQSGKVRHIGTSNMSPARIQSSLECSLKNGLPIYRTLQPHYNLYAREKFENQFRDLALENNLAVIPYFSLESGFLTGKYRSEADLNRSPRGGDMMKYLNDRGRAILKALDEVSAKHGTQQSAVALAWLLHQPAVTAPIASATSTEQLRGLFAAAQLKLDQEDLDRLEKASDY